MNLELRDNGDVMVKVGNAALCVRHGVTKDGRDRWDVCAGSVKEQKLLEGRMSMRTEEDGGAFKEIGVSKRFALCVGRG